MLFCNNFDDWSKAIREAKKAFDCPLVRRHWSGAEEALVSHWDAYRRVNGYDAMHLNIVYVTIRGKYVKRFQFCNHIDEPITPPLSAISAAVKLSKALNEELLYEI